MQLFCQDARTAPDSSDFNRSFDSSESDEESKAQSNWIVDMFLNQYKITASKFGTSSKLQSLVLEFMDLLETPYADSIFHDALDGSVLIHMREFILRQLQK
jgi:hypothetical protein